MSPKPFSVVHIDPSDAGYRHSVASGLDSDGVLACLDAMTSSEQRVMHVIDSEGLDVTHHERWLSDAL